MGKRIIKKIGGDRIGSGNRMTVGLHGYGYSTHDVSRVRRTSMSFGTIVPMNTYLMPSGSRLRIRLDALITSNALQYQLYSSAKFQIDVFSNRLANYNPKMLLNLNDQGYEISDIQFPQYTLTTRGYTDKGLSKPGTWQVNPSSIIRYLDVAGNGQNESGIGLDVTRDHNAHALLMYYQTAKEYYCNKQEKVGMMIHNELVPTGVFIESARCYQGRDIINDPYFDINSTFSGTLQNVANGNTMVFIYRKSSDEQEINPDDFAVLTSDDLTTTLNLFSNPTGEEIIGVGLYRMVYEIIQSTSFQIKNYVVLAENPDLNLTSIQIKEFDLKAVDRMQMSIMANVESNAPIKITDTTELPYGAAFQEVGGFKSVNATMEGLILGTYQSDVFNNWLDNTTINNLNNKNKVKVDENGEFSIDMLNITQKLYNLDMRIGVTDGTLDEWREVTYGSASKGKSLKPVYEGGLSKEIIFDQIVSTASTDEEPLGSIASRGQFGSKHKGGYVQIEADEEKMVMVLCKITPRIIYNQGNTWMTNLKTLDDLHKPALDKIGYQNLISDTAAAFETIVKADGTLITKSIGKQPAWTWYRTSYDDALGNMADTEDYKVFGRDYSSRVVNGKLEVGDMTTYIDPTKFNDVFAIQSLDAMNFDVQVGMDATLTLVMSEEVIPNL